MRNKILSAFIMAALPALTYAVDIRVTNNTDAYGTGHFNSFIKICSSNLGNSGILKPQQKDFVISGSSIKTACGSKDCEAFIFASDNCKGQKIATVVLNSGKGVINIDNVATDRFKVEYTATQVTVDNVKRSDGFKSWFKSLF